MPLDPATVRIDTPRLTLAVPGPRAARRTLAFFDENWDHLSPWEPPRPPDFRTEAHQAERLARDEADVREDRALRIYLFPRGEVDDGPVLGMVAFTQFHRGPLCACVLGYGLARRAEGQGFITEALVAAIRFVWDEVKLHRIQASYAPENTRSGRVLRRLGFTVEGYARDYLWTGGAWRDHLISSLVNPSFVPGTFTGSSSR